MADHRYSYITTWGESDLKNLPASETSEFEYKSSRVANDELVKKMTVAASAFWNSGGGIFIAGVNDSGIIDGGIEETVGRQSRIDWVHQRLVQVEPLGPYSVNIIGATESDSSIGPNKAVLIIGFGESPAAPHMAPDGRYYLRAGTHSLPATHFVVESIRARRAIQIPIIRAILEMSDKKDGVVNLLILVTNDASALNVVINFVPLPKMFEDISDSFPVKIPVIDQRHPLKIELFVMLLKSQMFGNVPVTLNIEYDDVLGRHHLHTQEIDPSRNRVPLDLTGNSMFDIAKQISSQLSELTNVVKQWSKR